MLIAQRTYPEKEKSNFFLLNVQLQEGSNDLMGYMGEYYKLHLEIQDVVQNEKHNLEYFVKCLPRKNEPQREECERKGVFRKESVIYSQLLPQIQKYGKLFFYSKLYILI